MGQAATQWSDRLEAILSYRNVESLRISGVCSGLQLDCWQQLVRHPSAMHSSFDRSMHTSNHRAVLTDAMLELADAPHPSFSWPDDHECLDGSRHFHAAQRSISDRIDLAFQYYNTARFPVKVYPVS